MASVQLLAATLVIIAVIGNVSAYPTKKTANVALPDFMQTAIKKAATTRNINSNGDIKKRVRRVPAAVAEKGMEIGMDAAGKAAEEMFDKIGESGERAAGYLENGASVDVQPQNGFASEDLLAPPAWHIEAHAEDDGGDDDDEGEGGEEYMMYPMGVGSVMMNGCWGSDYAPGDPCYEHRVPSQSTCDSMIDSAAFIGVGFDGRGEYSPESRKMSLIQRNCAGYSTYDGFDVPDTMNVHGIYETKSNMLTFEDRSEYSSYLQTEAGVSGSFLFFSAGVSTAYGRSTMSNQQKFMSLMDMDIVRYEIFKDVISPSDLSTPFLKEYMALPTSYMETGAPHKYQDFIQRWGTHYIKSGVFGGRLEIKKVASASFYSSVEEFSIEAKADFDSFFASFHAKFSHSQGSSQAKQSKFSSMSIKALGGQPDIAALVSDGGSPTSKTDLVNWLHSIADYPKAFRFKMAPITDLLYFQVDDIFPNKEAQNCFDMDDLKIDAMTGRKYYVVKKTIEGVTVSEKVYCNYESREAFMQELVQRRKSLEEAISIYLSEGLVSKSHVNIRGGTRHCGIRELQEKKGETGVLDWEYIKSGKGFSVMFSMDADITGGFNGKIIPKDQMYEMRHFAGKWFAKDNDQTFHLADGYSNGGTHNLNSGKISVEGLVLTYVQEANMFMLKPEDFAVSAESWTDLDERYKGKFLARAEWPISFKYSTAAKKNFMNSAITTVPCNLRWSNLQTFDLTERGACLYFSAISEGNIYVTFASVPNDIKTWYFVEITTNDASIHKYQYVLTETSNKNARGLGDKTLHQNYFVCIESDGDKSTLIEYGKFASGEEDRIFYLSYKDIHFPTMPRFYAFGSGSKPVTILSLDVHPRNPPTHMTSCGKGTVFDAANQVCIPHCDRNCDPDYSCSISASGVPSVSLCNECKTVKITMGTQFDCAGECPIDIVTVNGKKVCPCKWYKSTCLKECPVGSIFEHETSECTGGCDDIGEIEHGSRTGDDTSYTYTCDEGYYLDGEKTISCVKSAWSASKPECLVKPESCTRPSTPSNGRLSGNTEHGNQITLYCNTRYTVSGSRSIRCDNGQWIGTLGTCKYYYYDYDEDEYEDEYY